MRLGNEIRIIITEPEEIDVDEAVTAKRRAELEEYKAEAVARRSAATERHFEGMRKARDSE